MQSPWNKTKYSPVIFSWKSGKTEKEVHSNNEC